MRAPTILPARGRTRRRRRRLAPLALSALALAGCGTAAAIQPQPAGDQLTIYSSLPLQGPTATIGQAMVNGEQLALAQAHGHVGRFTVSFSSLDDTSPSTGLWSAGATAANAKIASQDKSTIAYIGDYESDATAISLPLNNANGILQISPASSYIGLTSPHDAGQDEPGRFYPLDERTFGRLTPGDIVQGEAAVAFLRHRHVHRLYVINDLGPFEASLAAIVSQDAQQAGIEVVADDGVDTTASDFSGEARKVAASGAQAVFFSGQGTTGAARLYAALHTAAPRLPLLGSRLLDTPVFLSQLGPAARRTFFMTPTLPPSAYPAAAQRFFTAYRRAYGYPAPSAALYGYEAMEDALQAIRLAGPHGDDRAAVVKAFFRIHKRESVLGSYSVLPSGDTTLSTYAVDRVSNYTGVPVAVLHVAAPTG